MSDRQTVAGSFAVLAALIVGWAFGVSATAEWNAGEAPGFYAGGAPAFHDPSLDEDGPYAQIVTSEAHPFVYGDVQKLSLHDDCDMLFPKHAQRHETLRWTKCREIERYGVVVSKANPSGDDYLQALYEESTREK
jgi:hypothetical protein